MREMAGVFLSFSRFVTTVEDLTGARSDVALCPDGEQVSLVDWCCRSGPIVSFQMAVTEKNKYKYVDLLVQRAMFPAEVEVHVSNFVAGFQVWRKGSFFFNG